MDLEYRDLGLMDYQACWDLQQRLFDRMVARKARSNNAPKGSNPKENTVILSPEETANPSGTILLVEHPPVYTLGRNGHAENLLISRAALEAMGAQFFHIDRGGDITFHGPGQLVCYPILDLEQLGISLKEYIRALEEAVIRTVAVYGITAGRVTGATGVWIGRGVEYSDEPVGKRNAKPAESSETSDNTAEPAQVFEGSADRNSQAPLVAESVRSKGSNSGQPNSDKGTASAALDAPRKICAIGVRASRYITMHGFALNVATDLDWFSRINPCGFTDRGVTSIERETGRKVEMNDVKALVVKFLSEILNVRIYKK